MGSVSFVRLGVSLAAGLCWLAFAGGAWAQVAAVLVEKEKIVEAQVRGAKWSDAAVGLELAPRDGLRTGEYSRAAVRFTDLSMLRVDELSTLEITAHSATDPKTLEMKRGGVYFFSREKPQLLKIRTAATNGALRGTEFALRVAANGRTTLAMFEGEVELSNPQGQLVVRGGEVAEVEVGGAPRKTSMIEAANLIQWCLYYPAVLDPAELGASAEGASLAAYRSGNLPGAWAGLARGSAPLYRAAVILSSGQVEKARVALRAVPARQRGRRALERMIAAVQSPDVTPDFSPETASEWLAESYAQQSRHDLEAARAAARRATELSPGFGFAWARLAELEFSFGRTRQAAQAVEVALELAPQHGQAHALQGFLLSAQNRMGAARRSFEEAIALDPALGNAWLGRGLTAIRQGNDEAGRYDLQTAAVLEPRRALLRSYLGKAYSQVGREAQANRELERAAEIDPADPTPWLYSAVERKQENRYNDAIADLEKSIALNDSRRVYRSRFLLDQDLAVRGTNLAAIYQNNGLVEQSVREAVRAVGHDYGSAAAHLFLANSYNALRDPTRIQLRYETAWFNELLLANLLSPVGAGPLSQFVSEQEYSKLFEQDGFGLNSLTEYRSDGQVRETASQYGTIGNLSYALDAEYFYDNGHRPNNEVSRFESYGTFKLQLSLQDTVFFQVKYQDFSSGDLFQRYDPRDVERLIAPDGTKVKNVPGLTLDFRETQEPGILLGGWHHEWSPGQHTVLLLGRLASDDELRVRDAPTSFLVRNALTLVPPGFGDGLDDGSIPRDRALYSFLGTLLGRGPIRSYEQKVFDLAVETKFETLNAELQQIITLGHDTLLLGGRYQRGEFETKTRLYNFTNGTDPENFEALEKLTIRQHQSVDFERINLYLYYFWRPAAWLTLTAGVTYDSLKYPENHNRAPVSDGESSLDEVSPKIGLALSPWTGATVRGAYTQAISGVSFDESVRLEPTQVAGFLQAYRSVISESQVGSVAGSQFKLGGLSFEQKLPSRTYLGVEYNVLQQDADLSAGAIERFDIVGTTAGSLPSSLKEKDLYREDSITATVNQLVGDCWSFGASYRFTHAKLRQLFPGFSDSLAEGLKTESAVNFNQAGLNSLAGNADRVTEADFHQVNLYALFNHPSGFFGRADANWYRQDNDRFITRADFSTVDAAGQIVPKLRRDNLGRPGDDFWQFNVEAGYRFWRNQCEVSAGVLNLTGADYQLDPLTPYAELPRDRTFVVRCKFNF